MSVLSPRPHTQMPMSPIPSQQEVLLMAQVRPPSQGPAEQVSRKSLPIPFPSCDLWLFFREDGVEKAKSPMGNLRDSKKASGHQGLG